ncbi:MAG: histidine kinase [Taibaiella sp.]|nr:histidine kinase [Taibaiella sp.]
MRKFAVWILLTVITHARMYAGEPPLPKDVVFENHSDIKEFTKYVIPCINWLQQTSINTDPTERSRIHKFVLRWLERNPDIVMNMPEYSLKFHGMTGELLYQFMEGWIKYILVTNNNTEINGSIAGLKDMLQYYKTGNGVARSEYMDSLLQIANSGNLTKLFDSSSGQHTFLFLDAPYNKHIYKHDENYFNFKFFIIDLIDPRGIQYRYMLEGYYDQWIKTTGESIAFPRLSPGGYKFRIQASGKDFVHPVERDYYFFVAAPIWQKPWFIILVIGGVFILIYLFFKQRENNLRNVAILQKERMRFEFEHLKSQVDPHFLFNSLNTLTHLIANDQEKAMAYTEQLSELYHNIIAHHDNDFVALAEELSILDNYISIQKGRFGNALIVNVYIDEQLKNTKRIIPLALQLLIENAIKHNVVSITQPLVISISANENEIVVKNTISPKISKEKSAGLGLLNINRRYSLLTKKQITYGIYDNEYIVTMPLL